MPDVVQRHKIITPNWRRTRCGDTRSGTLPPTLPGGDSDAVIISNGNPGPYLTMLLPVVHMSALSPTPAQPISEPSLNSAIVPGRRYSGHAIEPDAGMVRGSGASETKKFDTTRQNPHPPSSPRPAAKDKAARSTHHFPHEPPSRSLRGTSHGCR